MPSLLCLRPVSVSIGFGSCGFMLPDHSFVCLYYLDCDWLDCLAQWDMLDHKVTYTRLWSVSFNVRRRASESNLWRLLSKFISKIWCRFIWRASDDVSDYLRKYGFQAKESQYDIACSIHAACLVLGSAKSRCILGERDFYLWELIVTHSKVFLKWCRLLFIFKVTTIT